VYSQAVWSEGPSLLVQDDLGRNALTILWNEAACRRTSRTMWYDVGIFRTLSRAHPESIRYGFRRQHFVLFWRPRKEPTSSKQISIAWLSYGSIAHLWSPLPQMPRPFGFFPVCSPANNPLGDGAPTPLYHAPFESTIRRDCQPFIRATKLVAGCATVVSQYQEVCLHVAITTRRRPVVSSSK
jgi:hypothetical protein